MPLLTSLRLASDRLFTLAVALVVPRAASAAWGDENWGEMLWGATPPSPVPSVGTEGLIALVSLLLVASWTLLARRRKKAKG